MTALAPGQKAYERHTAACPEPSSARSPKWNNINEYQVPCLEQAELGVQSDGEPGDDGAAPEPK